MESLTKAFDGEIISWNGSESKPSSFEMVEQSTARAAPLLALLLAEESADGATITASYPAALPEDIQHDQLLQICGSGAAFTLVLSTSLNRRCRAHSMRSPKGST